MAGSVAREIVKQYGGKTRENLKVPVDALYFDETLEGRKNLGNIDWIAESIRDNGFFAKEPILVRPNKSLGKLEIIDGRRRYRAAIRAKELGWTGMVEVIPTEQNLSDEEFIFLTITSNNDSRKPFEPMEEGFYFKKLNDNIPHGHGKTLDEIAKKIGKSIPYVSDRINLVNLPDPKIKKELEHFVNTGVMSPTAAIAFAKLPENEHSAKWEELKKQHSEAVENNSNNLAAGKKVSTKKGIKVSDIKKPKKGPVDHISIKVLKSNMDVCRKMFAATKSEMWGKSLEVLEATFAGKIIQS